MPVEQWGDVVGFSDIPGKDGLKGGRCRRKEESRSSYAIRKEAIDYPFIQE